MKKKKNKKHLGIVSILLIITCFVMILSLILNILGVSGQQTAINNGLLESSLVTVNNIFSVSGIKYIFENIFTNMDLLKPLIVLIMSVMCTSVLESSGLINHLFSRFGKLKTPIITFSTILISILFGFLGEYSYIFLFSIIGSIYKSMGRNPIVGIISVFLGTTLGYGYGIFMNNDQYLMGIMTEQAAILDVDPSYKFNIFSTNYIMVIGTFLLTFVLTIFIEKNIMSAYKKIENNEDEYKTSNKGLIISGIIFSVTTIVLVIGILPKGFLLDNNSNIYMENLFGESSIIKNGLLFIFLIAFIIMGYIYGRISGNLETDSKANIGISKNFDKLGYVFVVMFFSSVLTSIINYTNIGTIIVTGLTNLISVMDFSGLFLVVTFIIITIIMTIVVPGLIYKWSLISPIIVPLFMRANMTPEFCQFLYVTSNSIGRTITPTFIYLLIMMGFMQKYNSENEDVTFVGTLKVMLPTILWVAGIMIVFVLLWYISGLPVGISGYPNL